MVRKKGKLPGPTLPYTYDLEYGSDTIEIQADAIEPGQKVFLLDDLLATGGTMNAAAQLLRSAGAEVTGAACIIELSLLNGRGNLDLPVTPLVAYASSGCHCAGAGLSRSEARRVGNAGVRTCRSWW